MGIPVMILGESGSGKTFSLRNIDPDACILIQAVRKPLPFKGSSRFKLWDREAKTGSVIVTDDSSFICNIISAAPTYGKKIIVIDDYQYTMANEFMRRATETGFTKFTEIASHAWNIATAATNAPSDVRIYILSHTNTDETGKVKIKTIGKMLDEKITLEGMFTIVLRSMLVNSQYQFSTQTNGMDTVKSPHEMFSTQLIDNDLNQVDQQIKSFYEIT